MSVELERLMEIEKELLLIERDSIFSLEMGEVVLLKRLLKEIGEITSIYFSLCAQYANTLGNSEEYEDKLRAYSERLMCGRVDYDVDVALEFISKHGS